MAKKSKKPNSKHRLENINKEKLPKNKSFIHKEAVKVISLNDEERLYVGDMAVIVHSEDDEGEPLITETRKLTPSDFENE